MPLRARGRVALVPTMGALHEGHLALMREARKYAESVVASIFVNPTQFAPHEDLATYPRPFEADIAKLESAGVDLLYAPSAEDMYPEGLSADVTLSGPALGLETDFRPHFFSGVITVVRKLFERIQPDVALFGEKDYQQLCVIRHFLGGSIEIIGVPTVREADGLALSSRNVYLSPAERQVAPLLHNILQEVAVNPALLSAAPQKLLDAGFNKVDYIALADAETLGAYAPPRPGRLLAAAWLGKTRLIDNIGI